MPICSRNLSMFCAAISAWGVIQLGIMGFLFYNQSTAFAEDLGLDVEGDKNPVNSDAFYKIADQKYTYTANNCWVAAGVYILLFLFSLQQFFSHK